MFRSLALVILMLGVIAFQDKEWMLLGHLVLTLGRCLPSSVSSKLLLEELKAVFGC